MKKKTYTSHDVEKKIEMHPDFDRVSGSYIISINSILLGPSVNGIRFSCTEDEFEFFVVEIVDGLLALSALASNEVPLEWIPLPGIPREKILKHYKNTRESLIELLSEDPNIIVLKKIAESGRTIRWERPDGRIGSGGFSTI